MGAIEVHLSSVSSLQEDLLQDDLAKHNNSYKLGLAESKNLLAEVEFRFEKWHISTPSGSAPKDLKKLLTIIWNTDRNTLYEFLRPIKDRFQMKFVGQQFMLYEHTIAFLDTNTLQPVILKASKLRGSSLQSIAAAKIASELENIKNIQTIVKQGLIPAKLENLLMKYL